MAIFITLYHRIRKFSIFFLGSVERFRPEDLLRPGAYSFGPSVTSQPASFCRRRIKSLPLTAPSPLQSAAASARVTSQPASFCRRRIRSLPLTLPSPFVLPWAISFGICLVSITSQLEQLRSSSPYSCDVGSRMIRHSFQLWFVKQLEIQVMLPPIICSCGRFFQVSFPTG